MSKLSLVVPALNEENVIRSSVERSLDTLEDMECDHEIIIVEDGCSDRTPEIASELAEKYPGVKHIHREERQGKGRAIQLGFENSEGDILAFSDADLSVAPGYLKEGKGMIDNGADMVVGSRLLKESYVEDIWFRKFLRTIYSSYIRGMFGGEVRDYQCGFKLFSAESYNKVSNSIRSEGFFWDTEIIARMRKNGYRIEEMPVEWERKPESESGLFNTGIKLLAKPLRLKKDFMFSDSGRKESQ